MTARRIQVLEDYMARRELPPITRLKAAAALISWNPKTALPSIQALLKSTMEPASLKTELSALLDRHSTGL